MLNILLVCTANICRSPAGQELLSRAMGAANVRIESAGTLAIDGNPADPIIQEMMCEMGYPGITGHRSRALLPSHLKNYQLILCMDRDHLDRVRRSNPVAVGKSMLLGHWSGGKEIADPVGLSREKYAYAIEEMQRYCEQWAAKIFAMEMV